MGSEKRTRRKLLVVRPTLGQGGADRVTVDLLRAFERESYELSLALLRSEGEFVEDVPSDVSVHVLGARSLWTAWWPLARLLRSERPDILFSTCSGANLPAVVAHRLTGGRRRLVLSERNVLFHGRVTLRRILLVLFKRILYPHADAITAVSKGVKEDMVRRLAVPDERISVVYNPIVRETIETLAAAPLDDPWFAPEEPPLILSVGRLVEEKGFPTLLDAFALVRARRPARLVILGEGRLRAELEEKARRLGLEGDVRLPGFDKNPFRWMARSAVFVLSSTHEGLPNVLLQAMACGVPVVSTDCRSGPSEIVDEGSTGYLVPVGDSAAMADRVLELLEDPGRRGEMGERARQAVASRFDAGDTVRQYERAVDGGER